MGEIEIVGDFIISPRFPFAEADEWRDQNMIRGFSYKNLNSAYRRLRKDTKRFQSYIVRDPLDFLDFEVDLKTNIYDLIREVNSATYFPARSYLHLSPKAKGINRPTVVFDIREALVYRFCIEQIEKELLKKTRQKGVYGGIQITPLSPAGNGDFYERWIEEWIEFLASIEKSLNNNYLVSTDIASYFETINILVLKDLVRSDVNKKRKLLNLLFYFLESASFRHDYEVNTFNGLPQESIDCSRILAYYFLHPHDEAMVSFCGQTGATFYRFVDDMNIIVKSEVEGKQALKVLTESLRRLGLVASLEKTVIYPSKEARKQLLFEENKALTKLELEIIDALSKKKKNVHKLKTLNRKLKNYYRHWRRQGKEKYKNWIKILKRFYTLATYLRSELLLPDIEDHLKSYPLIISSNKLTKYLIRLQRSSKRKFNQCLNEIIDYLYSAENLYQGVESHLLETILYFDPSCLDQNSVKRIKKLADDVFFGKHYSPLSNYARALTCLIIYRFEFESVDKLARHYLSYKEQDYLLKKYLIFVSLTTENNDLRQKVFDRAKKEQHLSIHRLVRLMEEINELKDREIVRSYIERNKVYIYKDEIIEEYEPVRAGILEKLIKIYA